MDFEVLKSLGVNINEDLKNTFIKYVDIFKNYNAHTNLISKNDEAVLFEKHIFDSIAFNLFVKKYGLPETLMDMGTGGGFPSVILAILYENLKISAVDSTAKKINFLKIAEEKLNLYNLNPILSRIEELPQDLKEKFDVVTTRALGSLPLILEYAIPYLKVGGYFVAYKSVGSDNELKSAQNLLKVLNTELLEEIEYKLPLKENFNRKLMIFKKKGAVSSIYPRPYNVIKKTLG